tara:strand:+ start:686 stop:2605 length:1920 start_codon:yes stop_codon:yes gene_type:complete
MKRIIFLISILPLKSFSQDFYGCIDSLALNFNSSAVFSDSSCYFICEESIDDIIDFNCNGQAYNIVNSPQVSFLQSSGASHINNPIGLCYDQNPPSSGPHRSMWGRWGEYEYMPPQRYLHNMEHGGITFLYHPCVDLNIIDSLRAFACSIPEDDGGDFRFILSPYPDLPSNIAVLSWEWTYLNNNFDYESILSFVNDHYRNAPEDFGFDGTYDNLYIGKCENLGCTDQLALNYSQDALNDDGSCQYDTSQVDFNEFFIPNSYEYVQNQIDSIMTIFPNCTDYPMEVLLELDSLFQVLDNLDNQNNNFQSSNSLIIQDSILYDYLNQNYPGIFIDNMLDTSISNQITSLNLDNLGIYQIEGLEYFSNLEYLYVNNNNLDDLHGLPESLIHLSCRSNNITSLHHFTENMIYLDARSNSITDIIGMPNHIESLKLCFNDLEEISFPDSLKYFLCASNNLQDLPNFPNNIIQVLVQNNQISSIQEIPSSMQTLMIQNNNLSVLPNIPESLTSLSVYGNPIECVNNYPSQFESQLDFYPNCLEYEYNQISELFQVWYFSIALNEGWNMFGYGCPEAKNLLDVLSDYLSKVIIVKDNQGNAYLPEFQFNGIGQLEPGYGYQLKLNDSINNFRLCDWYQIPYPEAD